MRTTFQISTVTSLSGGRTISVKLRCAADKPNKADIKDGFYAVMIIDEYKISSQVTAVSTKDSVLQITVHTDATESKLLKLYRCQKDGKDVILFSKEVIGEDLLAETTALLSELSLKTGRATGVILMELTHYKPPLEVGEPCAGFPKGR